jgi:hypothetical protein
LRSVHRQAEMATLQVPERDVDRTQRLDRQPLLPMVAQPVVKVLPMQFGGKRIGTDKEWLVEIDDRRRQQRRAKRLTPAAQPVFSDDLHQHCPAAVIPRLRIGKRFGERRVEPVGLDFSDLHSPNLKRTLRENADARHRPECRSRKA